MDWSSSKGPSWDWLELDQQQSFLSNNNYDGSDVDLKLGSVIGSSSSKSILPSKRARAANTTQTAAYYCLVDDCTSDLSNCRDYHRRHKVCEAHSKTPEVTIQGRKQRFCQQCSRFHALDEFDEGKRSCRKRLDGHNRRRRKSQPESQGTYLPNLPGAAGMLSFSNPTCHSHTMTSLISPNSWSGSENKIEDPFRTQPRLDKFTDYSSSRYREAKRLTLLQVEHQTNQHPTPQSSDHKVFHDGLTNTRAPPDSDCALSLLSRPMHATPTEINFRNAIPMRPHYSSGEPRSRFSLLQPTVSGSDVNFHNMFQTGPPDVPPNEPQTLPFYWE